MRVRRGIAFLILLAVLLSVAAFAYNGGVTVYVTRTGECYHRDGCSYLKSRIPISLENAVSSGYRACSRCHPPVLGQDRPADTDPYTRSGSSSSGSSSTSGGSSSAASSDPEVTAPPSTSNTEPGGFGEVLAKVFGVIFLGLFGIVSLSGVCAVIGVSGWGIGAAVSSVYENIRDAIDRRQERRNKRAEYMEMYANKPFDQLVQFPPGSYLTDDLLPATPSNSSEWGDTYTFFVSRTGQMYHRQNGCSGANIGINAFMLSEFATPRSNRRPCRRCNPRLPDMRWVQQCREIAEIKREYDIP